MIITLMGTVVIAGIVGYLAEKTGFTQNGYLQSIIICVGGAFLFYFVRVMFGFGFGSAGMNAIVSSIGALIIVPFHWRK
ncbi:MAG: putative membrane protein YeaQ/YmgE (transglycosylase-associated protein family) [Paracoccaceae bacterium]